MRAYWYLRPNHLEEALKAVEEVGEELRALFPRFPFSLHSDPPLLEAHPPEGRGEVFRFPRFTRLPGEPWAFAACRLEDPSHALFAQSALLLLKARLGRALRLSSDGGFRDWIAAHAFLRQKGYPLSFWEALDREVFRIVPKEGEPFLVPLMRGLSPDTYDLHGLLRRLEEDERRKEGWPFRGPYRVAARLRPPPELLVELEGLGVYRLADRPTGPAPGAFGI